MRRIILSGAAAAAFAGAATAQAAEPIKLGLGGYINAWAGYVSNQNGKDYGGTNVFGNAFGGNYPTYSAAAAASGALRPQSVDQQSDIELDIKGSTKLDNGLSVAVEVELSPSQGVNARTYNAANNEVKRAYATLSGQFGALEVGQQDNVGYLIHNSAPDVTGIGGQDKYWMDWVLAPAGHRGTGRTYAGDDRVDDKVIYVTPSYHGFAAGFSYTPSVNTRTAGATEIPSSYDSVTIDPATGKPVANGDLFVYGIAYNDMIGDVSVKADIGAGQANIGGLTVYQGGLRLSYAGFTLGGSYLQRNVRNSSAVFQDALAKGAAWDAGLSYAIGPYSVAVNYFAERAAKGNTTDANTMAGNGGLLAAAGSTSVAYDRDRVLAVEGAYNLGPGVSVNETLFHVKYTDAYGVAAEQNQGWGLLTGLSVKF